MNKKFGMAIGIILGIVAGLFFAIYGAILAIFADPLTDNPILEILARMAIVILIYGLLGMIWGLLWPSLKWKWGLFIGIPGSLIISFISFTSILTGSTVDVYSIMIVIYAVMLLIIPCLTAWGGSVIRNKLRRKTS